MKRKVISFVLSVSLLLCATPLYSHSGRTDSSGGHRDNNNVSGLGSYHYHHGYGPHLHPNGVCPYASTPSPTPAPAPTPTPAPQIKIYIDNQLQSFAQQPIIESGTTLVPMRACFESLGATVNWNNDTQTVTSRRNNIEIKLSIGNRLAYVNGTAQTLSVPGKLVNGYTYIPLRFVGEALGDTVVWDGSTNTIKIYKK
jgi:hypothetical protein